MTIPSEKTALRSEVLARRSEVGPALRLRMAERIAEVGLDLVRGFAEPQLPVVSAYLPMRGEAETLPLLAMLSAEGIATVLPVMVAPARPLQFLAWRPGDPLRSVRYGILEPQAQAPEYVPDVLFLPLAAFDGRGFRLGYGGGYYDATLAGLRRRKRTLAVGVAFSIQEVARVPSEAHDEPLDAVVTEYGLRLFGKS